jgi:hypothetical protein
VSDQLYALVVLLPGKKSPVPTGEVAEGTPEPVWTQWNRKESLASARYRTPEV